MLLRRYSRVFILFVFGMVFSQALIAAVKFETQCGRHLFQIKISNELERYKEEFKFYYQINGGKEKLFYKTKNVTFLNAACIQNKNKEYLMFFQEYFGGNADPEDMYGIFDPEKKKFLIKPADWPNGNEKEVQKIIGYSPNDISGIDDDGFFCCSRVLYNPEFGSRKK